jgi:hypothetical protein
MKTVIIQSAIEQPKTKGFDRKAYSRLYEIDRWQKVKSDPVALEKYRAEKLATYHRLKKKKKSPPPYTGKYAHLKKHFRDYLLQLESGQIRLTRHEQQYYSQLIKSK